MILRDNLTADSSASVRRTENMVSQSIASYSDWCVHNGFAESSRAKEILDVDNIAPPQVSPLFCPKFYQEVNHIPNFVNPYYHYFETGFRFNVVTSPLLPNLRGVMSPGADNAPRLLRIIERLSKDEEYSPHPLYDTETHRRSVRKRKNASFVAFLREWDGENFSCFFDVEMFHHNIPTWNPRAKNPLVAYVENRNAVDVNPLFFSGWYRFEYQISEDDIRILDLLTHYLQIGSRRGYFPNPFYKRDLHQRGLARGSVDQSTLLEAIRIKRASRIRDISHFEEEHGN